jgi:polyhydroxybutyrate depolymerase
MKKIILVIALLIGNINCFAQLKEDSLLIENHYRSFYFKKPSSTNTNSSLIFILHGSGSSGEKMLKYTKKLDSIAEKENLILVYPNGYKNYWNECRKSATSAANLENINENEFFNQLITYFSSHYQINTNHIFAIGYSGGGHMAYKLAMTMPDKIKGITALVASIPDTSNMDCIDLKVALPVMIINGTNDPINPYEGGEINFQGAVLGKVQSTEASFAYWAAINGYEGKPKKEFLPDVNTTDGKKIEKWSYKEKNKPEVILLKVINGKHEHPSDIDIYIEAWNLFKRSIDKK